MQFGTAESLMQSTGALTVSNQAMDDGGQINVALTDGATRVVVANKMDDHNEERLWQVRMTDPDTPQTETDRYMSG